MDFPLFSEIILLLFPLKICGYCLAVCTEVCASLKKCAVYLLGHSLNLHPFFFFFSLFPLLPHSPSENFDTKKNMLTRQGFLELNLMEANDREGDPRDLWITLEAMGFNRALEMVEVRNLALAYYIPRTRLQNLLLGNLADGPIVL